MMPSFISKRKTNSLYLFIVSVDKLFVKKLNQHLGNHAFDTVIVRSSGEGFFKELAFNPLPKGSLAIVIADYVLVDRDHLYAKDGLEVLMELEEKYPTIERILLLTPANKSIKNKAIKQGIEHVLVKNDNAIVRFDILINGIVSQLKLKRTKSEFFLLLWIFVLVLLSVLVLIASMTLFE